MNNSAVANNELSSLVDIKFWHVGAHYGRKISEAGDDISFSVMLILLTDCSINR